MVRSLVVMTFASLLACTGNKTPAGACAGNDDCAAGEVCFVQSCELLCGVDGDCGTENDCAHGRICKDGVCAPGCRANVPSIESIDGDGTADGTTDARGTKSAHHLQTQLLVLGSNLDGAQPTLTPLGGEAIDLTVVSSSPTQLAANLPPGLSEGEYTLMVSNAVGSDQAGVWVLQGEQGLPGQPQTGSGVLQLLQSLGDPVPGLNAATAASATTAATATSATSAGGLTDASGTRHTYAEIATPAGAVMFFARATCPTGWVSANGTIAARAAYPDLFAAIGTTFGAGDGSTTFGLPDFRGEFLRALDSGRGVDAARALGSAQGHDWKTFSAAGFTNGTYTHGDVWIPKSGYNTSYPFGGYWSAPGNLLRFQWDTTSEIRPRNVALLACLKT